MAAPSRGLYIFVSICCFMVIPLGLLAPKVGPKLIDAWKFRKLGRPQAQKGPVVGYVVSSGDGEESVLLDLSGKEVRRWKTSGAEFDRGYDCFGLDCLSNGNVLFSSLVPDAQGQVREFDREGQEVWRLPETTQLCSAASVQRLANGNTLVAEFFERRVREFTPAGEEVWRYQDAQCFIFDAERLHNKNTLLALADRSGPSGLSRAREVDPQGRTVWEFTASQGLVLFSARRLANGNTLLAANEGPAENSVAEVDRAGRVVWRHAGSGGGSSASARRLPDGRTLIGQYNPHRVVLVSPDGQEEVLYTGPANGRACPVYAGR